MAHEARVDSLKSKQTSGPQQQKIRTNSKILNGYTLRCKCMTNVRERPWLTGSPRHLAGSDSVRNESSGTVDINTQNDIERMMSDRGKGAKKRVE